MDAPNNKYYKLVGIYACAGQLEQRRNITEVVIDGVGITEGQFQHACSVNHSTRKCNNVGTKYKYHTCSNTERHRCVPGIRPPTWLSLCPEIITWKLFF